MRRPLYPLLAAAALITQLAAPAFAHVCHREGGLVTSCACEAMATEAARIRPADCCQDEPSGRMPAVASSKRAESPALSAPATIVCVAMVHALTPVIAAGPCTTAHHVHGTRPIFQSNCSYRI